VSVLHPLWVHSRLPLDFSNYLQISDELVMLDI
jgi:hypothetical protein